MVVPVEKGIPIPKPVERRRKRGSGRPAQYPWTTMEVGDSFLLVSVKNANVYTGVANKRYAPKVFTGRMTETGFRIWRTE